MDRKSKKKYEAPMIIQLGQVPVVQGKDYCTAGNVAKVSCSTGNTVNASGGGSISIEPQIEEIEPNYEKIQPGLDTGSGPHIEPKVNP